MTTARPTVMLIPDRLNREPAVFRGLTHTEMLLLIKLGAAIWFPFCIALCWWLEAAVIGLGMGMAMTLATVMAGGMLLQRRKRGRPEGWYERGLKIALQEYGISRFGFCRYSGAWDSRRQQGRLR